MGTEKINYQESKGKRQIALTKTFLEAISTRRQYKITLCHAGFLRAMGGTQSNRYVAADTLKAATDAGKFNELAVFVDHAGFFEYPKVERLVAVINDTVFDEETESVQGTITFYERALADEMVSIFDAMLAEDNPPDIGFSLVFWGAYGEREEPDDPLILTKITHVESCDIVFEPALAGSRVLEALSAIENNEVNKMPPEENEITNEESSSVQAAERESTVQLGSFENHQTASQAIEERNNSQVETWMAEVIEELSGLRQRLTAERENDAIDLSGPPPRDPNIVMGLNGYEELQQAALALLSGQNPPKGVRPLSGIRELYLLLSGDYEMTGRFNDDRVQFAAVDSSTLANLFADALNKAVIEIGSLFPRWWEPAVTTMNFNTLHDAKFIMMGGVGELPTVAEGSAYTEMTLDDQQESSAFVKKGGYLGITLEGIDKDDTRRIQAIPRTLVRAAWLTLGKSISAIFTENTGTGPTLDTDSTVLFHTNHSNLGGSALSYSSWIATRTVMFEQTEINSGEVIGPLTAPYLLWVPVELEFTALQILASANEPGTANNDINPEVMDDGQRARLEAARRRVIVPPFWTDANNWAAQANPMLYPSIGLGYRFGENPEIFSVADPRAGLMFSNDVMPVKVRYFYAVGPIDYRGLYKHNVT